MNIAKEWGEKPVKPTKSERLDALEKGVEGLAQSLGAVMSNQSDLHGVMRALEGRMDAMTNAHSDLVARVEDGARDISLRFRVDNERLLEVEVRAANLDAEIVALKDRMDDVEVELGEPEGLIFIECDGDFFAYRGPEIFCGTICNHPKGWAFLQSENTMSSPETLEAIAEFMRGLK